MPMRPAVHRRKAQPVAKHDPAPRLNSTQRGYGYKWQQAREGYLRKHPLCKDHQDRGMIVMATEVDHIIAHKGGMELFWDSDNWQSLCKSCHSIKTAREDGSFGR
jgi:5-methylcytosine-specific restriction protein A